MVDLNTVCCMCGDVGFPDKLFRCARCLSRFQHSYCSNYYEENSSEAAGFCDWCRSEERNVSRHVVVHSKKPAAGKEEAVVIGNRADYPGSNEKIKQNSDREENSGGRGKNTSGGAGPSGGARTTGRRYKLLKDVLC